jgi:hypothetical protein
MFARVWCGVTMAFAAAAGCSSGGPSMVGIVDGGNTPATTGRDGGKSTSDARASHDAETTQPNLEDEYLALPVSGGADAPRVASVTVRCASTQSEVGQGFSPETPFPAAVVEVARISDPQGAADLIDSRHELVLYGALDGSDPESQFFDVDTSGISFAGFQLTGYFSGAGGNAIRAEWCDKEWWPAKIVLTDNSGHVTSEKIRVPVLK